MRVSITGTRFVLAVFSENGCELLSFQGRPGQASESHRLQVRLVLCGKCKAIGQTQRAACRGAAKQAKIRPCLRYMSSWLTASHHKWAN